MRIWGCSSQKESPMISSCKTKMVLFGFGCEDWTLLELVSFALIPSCSELSISVTLPWFVVDSCIIIASVKSSESSLVCLIPFTFWVTFPVICVNTVLLHFPLFRLASSFSSWQIESFSFPSCLVWIQVSLVCKLPAHNCTLPPSTSLFPESLTDDTLLLSLVGWVGVLPRTGVFWWLHVRVVPLR